MWHVRPLQSFVARVRNTSRKLFVGSAFISLVRGIARVSVIDI